jgi:hypothetical protein
MNDELRARLERKSTEELVEIALRHDVNEWRPEVFAIVDEVLKSRGADVSGLGYFTRTPEPEETEAEFPEVLALSDPGVLALAESILDEAGIRFYVANDEAPGLFGAGQLGGPNQIAGPQVLRVQASRLEEAGELLATLIATADATARKHR